MTPAHWYFYIGIIYTARHVIEFQSHCNAEYNVQGWLAKSGYFGQLA